MFGVWESSHEMECRLLLDVVVGEGAAVLELLARKDQALLIGGDAFLILRVRQAGTRQNLMENGMRQLRTDESTGYNICQSAIHRAAKYGEMRNLPVPGSCS
jgi:hypothetical protein